MDQHNRISAEIAHVLFVDIVGYSLLSMEEQAREARTLRDVVRHTAEFTRGETRGDLIRLDTGDGMALVFFRDPIAPIQCAVEIAEALGKDSGVSVRMGIHSGPVSRTADINGKDNVSGSGINIAQRVMDCGAGGHILLSARYAEDLAQFDSWSPHITDLGECTVKHGAKLHVYRYSHKGIGSTAPIRVEAEQPAHAPQPGATGSTESADLSAAPSIPRDQLEPVGGAVPLNSMFYVERPTDIEFKTAIARRDSIVLVKGARQMGKTSLLARGLQQSREIGCRVVLTDFQTLNASHLATANALFYALAEILCDQLDLDVDPETVWNPERGPNMNLERYLRRAVFAQIDQPIVWGLDEVDRLFTCEYGSEVFGLFRSWHNKRALDPTGPWSRLTLVIAYATEAHLFIRDLNQSPFNVGTRLALQDFTEAQTADLNIRYGAPIKSATDLAKFHTLLNGHPYLIRRGLDELSFSPISMNDFIDLAESDEGIYSDHLRRIQLTITQDPALKSAVVQVLNGTPVQNSDEFYRLRSTGIVTGDGASAARIRCPLYDRYLRSHLAV
jgi:class 3 adenylate cyclase